MTLENPTSQIDRAAGVVRKPIDVDCLLGGQLHPSVADRLARVRDLPVMAMANLRSVDRDASGVWLVWQYIEGKTLPEYLAGRPDPEELDRIRRDLSGIVEQIHAHGIVHGAIHANNVIIDLQGRVRMTHISPLLYSDPDQDLDALQELLAAYAPPPSEHALVAEKTRDRETGTRIRAYLLVAASILSGILIFWAILWYIRP